MSTFAFDVDVHAQQIFMQKATLFTCMPSAKKLIGLYSNDTPEAKALGPSVSVLELELLANGRYYQTLFTDGGILVDATGRWLYKKGRLRLQSDHRVLADDSQTQTEFLFFTRAHEHRLRLLASSLCDVQGGTIVAKSKSDINILQSYSMIKIESKYKSSVKEQRRLEDLLKFSNGEARKYRTSKMQSE